MRPAEPRRRIARLLAAATIVVLGGFAAWFLRGEFAPSPTGGRALTPEGSPASPRALTPSEIADPDEAHRAAVRLDQMTRFEAMRAAFEAGGRDTPASRARLEPALQSLWPARPATYRLACREAVCRIDLPSSPETARAALASDRGVRAVADGVFLDPDGVDPAGYVLLAAANAAPGQDVLTELEQEFTRSSEARECLSRAGAVGRVEYEVQVDGSGFTYRTRTDLSRDVRECLESVLNGIITATAIPSEVKAASITLALRR
ncbi:MAG: hypothetical protein WCK73_18150 [Deltaproteobacteria bacterium]